MAELPLTVERTVLSHLPRCSAIGLGEPHMAIDAGALVEPAVAEAGVDARDDVVLRAVGEEVGQIEAEGRIAVVVAADEAAVDKDQHVAEGAVELDRDAAAQVAGGNLELAPIPAHAGLGIAAAERACSRATFCSSSWTKGSSTAQSWGRLSVRHLESSNLALAKSKSPVLAKSPWPYAEAEIAGRIAAVAELELPAEVEEQMLARRELRGLGRRGLGRPRAGWQRAPRPNGRASEEAESCNRKLSRLTTRDSRHECLFRIGMDARREKMAGGGNAEL